MARKKIDLRSRLFFLALSLSFALALSACNFPGSTQPVIKIGLVAPFEGRYRSIGYEAIYAARLAIREINANGGLNGYRIELVALDDRGDPDQAIEAARKLAIDPQVIAVIGHYRPDSTEAAIGEYCEQKVPVIAIESAAPLPEKCWPPIDAFVLGHASIERWISKPLIFVSNVPSLDGLADAQSFASAYNAIPIDGTRPGPIALQTYDAMYVVFEAIRRAPRIDRVGVAAAIADNQFKGLGASYQFDPQGKLIDARTFIFEYGNDGKPKLIP